MDPDEDPPTSSSSHDDVGTIRWADDGTASTSSTTTTTTAIGTPTTPQRLRNKVTYYEKVWSSGQKSTTDDTDETDHSAFAIDVHAFEKRLQEERERKSHEQSPRIDVKLRSTTPQPSPRQIDLPTNIKVNIRHHIESGDSSGGGDGGGSGSGNSGSQYSRAEREIETSEYRQHHARVLTYEKVTTQKSVRQVNITSTSKSTNVSSPLVRTVEYTEVFGKSPSQEQITTTDDSAYHSHAHRTRIVSSSTTTTAATSKSSSNTSLHGNFTSDENVTNRRTPSRERIFERAGSEPHSWSSVGSSSTTSSNVATGTGGTSGLSHGVSPVSSVAAGNENVRRHFVRDRHDSEGDGNSSDWYNEYRTQSFHTVTPRMDFKRSNSQYDNHIKQIRGIHFNFNIFLYSTS